MKIYTKTGDGGSTGLVGGSRVSKSDPRIQAIGDLDEANAHLGFASTQVVNEDLLEIIKEAQAWLFEVGAELASVDGRNATISEVSAKVLEESMDRLTAELPPLTHFILPGGSSAAASLHIARAAVRRAERAISAFESASDLPVRKEVKVLVNRLSDWLFTAARTANYRAGVSDVIWETPEKRASAPKEVE